MPDSQPDTSTTPGTQPAAQSAEQSQQAFFEGAGFPEATDDTATTTADTATAANTTGTTTTRAPRTPPSFSLKISADKNGVPLGKAQRVFNRLIRQIEELRAFIAKERRRLDNALQYHVQKLLPLQRQVAARRGQIAIFAHTQLKTARASFTRNQQSTLRDFISAQLRMIINSEGGLPDEKLQAIFADIEGATLNEARRRELDAEREKIEMDMADLGVDIDLSAVDDAKTPEEFERAMADTVAKLKKAGLNESTVPPDLRHFFARFFNADSTDAAPNSANSADPAHPAAKPRKKTKKQLEREAREKAIEDARARSLSSIYKQLARVLHPDLEQDPARKKEKEALMQQLTAAYRANDMHTLLRLELEWLQHSGRDTERLSDEKLAIYNEVLREQVAALQFEQQMLPADPRYESLRPYMEVFAGFSQIHTAEEEAWLNQNLRAFAKIDTNATGAIAIKTLKTILGEFTKQRAALTRQQAFDEETSAAMEEMISDMRGGRPRRW